MMENMKSMAGKFHLWFLGLLMVLPGLQKLFIMGPDAITGMLSGIVLFSWAPSFWAWILILSEIVFGALILAKWKLEYTTIPPMIILVVALLFVGINWSDLLATQFPNVMFHLVAISGYWMLMSKAK